MATAIPKAYLASSAIRCRDVETGPNLGVLAVFPSTGATCRCPLRCFRHQLLLPRPYLVLTKPLRLDIQSQRGASVKIGWKYLDD